MVCLQTQGTCSLRSHSKDESKESLRRSEKKNSRARERYQIKKYSIPNKEMSLFRSMVDFDPLEVKLLRD